MTRIRASCPECGEVDLLPADVTLQVIRHGSADVAAGSSYRFSCPDCEELVTKPADERIAQLLTSGGVEVEVAGVEVTGPPHPEFPPGGPALTHDDLIDFHELLDTGDWFERLVAVTP